MKRFVEYDRRVVQHSSLVFRIDLLCSGVGKPDVEQVSRCATVLEADLIEFMR